IVVAPRRTERAVGRRNAGPRRLGGQPEAGGPVRAGQIKYYRLFARAALRPARPPRAPARRLSALPLRRGMACPGAALRVDGRAGRPAWFRSSRPGRAPAAGAAGSAALRAGRVLVRRLP